MAEGDVKYPNVEVQLSGEDGNAFSILGAVSRALKKANVPLSEVNAFYNEATKGSYDELLQTCMRWVVVK